MQLLLQLGYCGSKGIVFGFKGWNFVVEFGYESLILLILFYKVHQSFNLHWKQCDLLLHLLLLVFTVFVKFQQSIVFRTQLIIISFAFGQFFFKFPNSIDKILLLRNGIILIITQNHNLIFQNSNLILQISNLIFVRICIFIFIEFLLNIVSFIF